MRKLLVVDDEPIICHSFRRIFAGPGTEALTVGTAAEARTRLEADCSDVVVPDDKLPDGSALELLRSAVAANPRRPVVMITAFGTAETAVEPMKWGAFDYVLKPLDLEKLTQILDRAFDAARLM
jgi:two-component system nitrogen regulation response regulator GlnG